MPFCSLYLVLAMVSLPDYDTNQFGEVQAADEARRKAAIAGDKTSIASKTSEFDELMMEKSIVERAWGSAEANRVAARLSMPREKSAARIGRAPRGRPLSSAMVMCPVPQQISSTAASGSARMALNLRAVCHHHSRSTLADRM